MGFYMTVKINIQLHNRMDESQKQNLLKELKEFFCIISFLKFKN